MDPKQTAPQGGQPGGQEGQNGQAQSTGANPVFGAAGNLGGNTLSTGANVSQTMDSLNSGNSFASGKSLLQRKRVDNVDPVTGDIIISSSPNDKPAGGLKPINKALLIKIGGVILVLGAIALVVGIIFAFVSGGDKKSSNGGTSSSLSVDVAFNNYANYMLSGEASSEPVNSAISISGKYEVYNVLSESAEDLKGFYQSAKTHFDNFITSYDRSDLSEKSAILKTLIPSHKEVFYFLYNYSQVGLISTETLAPIYISEGDDGLENYFTNNYSVFSDSTYSRSKDFYNNQKTVFDYYKKFLEDAKKKKCISDDGVVSANCKVSMKESDTQSAEEANETSQLIIKSATNNLVNGIATIRDEINNPTSAEKIKEMSNANAEGESN